MKKHIILILCLLFMLSGCSKSSTLAEQPDSVSDISSGTKDLADINNSGNVKSSPSNSADLAAALPSFASTSMYYSINVPTVVINTDEGKEILSKDEYLKAGIYIYNGNDCDTFDTGASVKCRGNYSFKPEKKSYKIKFDNAENPLGIGAGKAKTWTLIANVCDQSMLRDYLAYSLAASMGNFGWTPACTFVQVFINENYRGVYLLCEAVSVNECRININEDKKAVDTGYLVELDKYATAGDEGLFYIDETPYVIKSDGNSDEQTAFISNYMSECYAAVQSGNRDKICEMIDIESCIDMYIVQEYFKNLDAGWSSFYFYKDTGSKLYFGPVWDFDIAAGNDYRLDNGSYEGIYVGNPEYNLKQSNRWFTALCGCDWFRQQTASRWNEIQDRLDALSDKINESRNNYAGAFVKNFNRWDKTIGKRNNNEPEAIIKLDSVSAHIEYLEKWLHNRRNWLNDYFNN